MEKLLKIMEKLRDPKNGCPWDIEQDFESIAPYTIEEAYEIHDAIERQNWSDLKEELGDLLLQVVFHSQMAKEKGLFSFNDVVDSIAQKMIDRHPHVFGDKKIESAEAQSMAWEDVKKQERLKKKTKPNEHVSQMDNIPLALPALKRSEKLQKRAAQVGFDWTTEQQIINKINEELEEVKQEIKEKNEHSKIQEEIGDLLFAVSNLARKYSFDVEETMKKANKKFEKRFRQMEKNTLQNGQSIEKLTIDEMEQEWQNIKKAS